MIVTDAQLQEGSVYTEPPAVTMIVGDEYGSHDSSDFLVEPDSIQEYFQLFANRFFTPTNTLVIAWA